MDKYTHNQIADFAAQLKRGPRRLRIRELLNLQFLLSIVEAGKSYPFDFVCHAVTGFRGRNGTGDARLLDGETLITDLVILAEDLSDDAGMPHESHQDPLYSVEELAERFRVSSKTIFRWRRRGLAGWRFRFADGRRRLMFTEPAVRGFVARNLDLVERGGQFSQLTRAERQQIVARAQELVGGESRTVNAVARSISDESGRAVETIRLILKHHDEAHPGAGLFNRTPLAEEADEQSLAIWEAYVDGATVAALAERFDTTVPAMYRTVTRLRARELKARKIEYVTSAEFEQDDAAAVILQSYAQSVLRQPLANGKRHMPAELPPYLAQLFRVPLLTAEGEAILFRKMNFLKHQAVQRLAGLDAERCSAGDLDEITDLLAQAEQVKNELVQANLRLVVSIAKRHVRPTQELFELISDGNVSLMRAVDKFDYSRGFKFSTYASWAIMRNFARSIPEQHTHRERYQTGWDEALDSMAHVTPEDDELERLAATRKTLEQMLETLDQREREILRRRFGLDNRGQTQTLEQVGKRLGVSKERVRQLEARAINRLRGTFADEVEALLGV